MPFTKAKISSYTDISSTDLVVKIVKSWDVRDPTVARAFMHINITPILGVFDAQNECRSAMFIIHQTVKGVREEFSYCVGKNCSQTTKAIENKEQTNHTSVLLMKRWMISWESDCTAYFHGKRGHGHWKTTNILKTKAWTLYIDIQPNTSDQLT